MLHQFDEYRDEQSLERRLTDRERQLVQILIDEDPDRIQKLKTDPRIQFAADRLLAAYRQEMLDDLRDRLAHAYPVAPREVAPKPHREVPPDLGIPTLYLAGWDNPETVTTATPAEDGRAAGSESGRRRWLIAAIKGFSERCRKVALLASAVIGFAVVFQAAISLAAPMPGFRGLGDLPGGSVFSRATGVSADGTVVVGYSQSARGTEAFRWSAGAGMVALGDLPGGTFASHAWGISADGSTIVGDGSSAASAASCENCTEAVLWSRTTGMERFGGLSPRYINSVAYGVSADGSVLAGTASDPQSGNDSWFAFRWTAGSGMEKLWGGSSSDGRAVSADGSVIVGGVNTSSGIEAGRWTAVKGMIRIGLLPGSPPRPNGTSVANAVSTDGMFVVGSGAAANGCEAFRWSFATDMERLGDLPGGLVGASALGVSADGSVVIGSSSTDRGVVAFIWDESHGMQNLRDVMIKVGLHLDSWTLTAATAITPDGRTIIGCGRGPSGHEAGWVARLPEPAARSGRRLPQSTELSWLGGGHTAGWEPQRP